MTNYEMPPAPGSDTGQPPAMLWDAEGVEWVPVFPDGDSWINPASQETMPWPELLFNYGPLTDVEP